MKKQLLLLVMMLLPMVAKADVEIDGIYYNLITKAKQAEVTGGSKTVIVIPESVTYNGENYTVTSIKEKAFQLHSSLTSVTIPNTVTSIEPWTFYECTGLTSITIPNSVTSIGMGAFEECRRLKSITIPSSVTNIGLNAFNSCFGLTAVHISDLEAWCKISFAYNYGNPLQSAHHLYMNGEEIKDLVIPNNVTSIESNNFKGCSGLTSITIPNSVTSIGWGVFAECTGLTSITIPNSVTKIKGNAFKGCIGLTSVTLGSGISSIESEAFASCPELKDVYCYAKNAPSTNSNAFNDSYIDYATLHVQTASVNSYKAKEPWKNFKNIIALTDSDPKPTGIDDVRGKMSDVRDAYYDLNGRRLTGEPTKKGIYINNGQKVVVK